MGNILQRRSIVCLGRLYGERGGTTREKRFPHHWVFNHEQHVGGVSPEITATGNARLCRQLPPGCTAVFEIARRITRMQGTRNGLSHRIVDQQTIAGANHNGQATQPLPGILGRHIRKQRLQ